MSAAAVLIITAALAFAAACAQAPAKTAHGDEPCPIDPERFVVVEEGTVPLVLSSTHAGTSDVLGCDNGSGVLRPLEQRSCTASLDVVCESGPCRSGGPDGKARELTFALRDALSACLGGRPALALTEIERSIVDMNRDAGDVGGFKCALGETAARPYWDAYHRALEGLVSRAVAQGGDHALLLDIHTYASLPSAPPPAIMLGTGDPVGLTVPHLAAEDPALPLVYGAGGLRARLLENLSHDAGLKVLPASVDAELAGLFVGRYVVRRYARTLPDETKNAGPSVDSIQIEVSKGPRDDVAGTAAAIASAVCGAFGERLHNPGSHDGLP